jgi:hypothetical protein
MGGFLLMVRGFLMSVGIARSEIKLLGTALRFTGEGRRRDVAIHIAAELGTIAIRRDVALPILSRRAIASGTPTTTTAAAAT